MNVKIVEFYTVDRNDEKGILQGSLHVQLADLQIEIRGIQVKKRKDTWYFWLPSLKGKDPATGELVRFPVFAFEDREKTKELKDIIREKGTKYIQETLSI